MRLQNSIGMPDELDGLGLGELRSGGTRDRERFEQTTSNLDIFGQKARKRPLSSLIESSSSTSSSIEWQAFRSVRRTHTHIICEFSVLENSQIKLVKAHFAFVAYKHL